MLFFDPRLSGSGWISCATCHNPGLSWEDRLPVAMGNGMKHLSRRTPTISNLAWAQAFFWDGRAGSLEEQAIGPITAAGEMGGDMSVAVSRIQARSAYRELFAKAYPGEPIAAASVQKAIAAFERTVVTGRAPFDEWVDGNEYAIGDAAKRGFVTFNTRGKCSLCHSGWRFTDDSFHDIGVTGYDDLGRGALLTQLPAIQHAFKTPSLRNVAKRGPYMHNGSETSIAEVIDLYDLGGREKRPSLAHEIEPLNLTAQERSDLLTFLESLNSKDAPVTMPELP
jgi:cytochrome c peroxidase